MININVQKSSMTLFAVLAVIGAFFWYQVRPSRIKHDCSWVKVTEASIPAYPMMTEDELKEKGMLQQCIDTWQGESSLIKELNERRKSACEADNRKLIGDYSSPRVEVPEKISWKKASNEEYSFCLHDKGL